MIRAVHCSGDGKVRQVMRTDEFSIALQDPAGLLWVDLLEEPVESCRPVLSDIFGFHPLAVDDALEETHVPKVDDWGDYVYVALRGITYDEQMEGRLGTLELDVFVGSNYLVTYQARRIGAIDRVWDSCQRDERHLQKSTAHLLYRVADELVSDYMPAVDKLDEALDQIEDQVFDDPTSEILESIFGLKRSLLHLRRMIAPQREVVNRLARGDYAQIDPDDRVFFRDVYDHLVRLYDLSESLRDLAGSALDTYLSVVNNRMNEVMKALTIITTLFMPLSFVVGFFGMNFFQPIVEFGGWTGRMAFALTLAGMIIAPLVMYIWMRRRAWM